MDDQSFRHAIRSFFNVRDGRASYEVIRRRVLAGARIDGTHVVQLIAAMLIASVGLNVNSTESVIGAMLICPLMGSVLAMAYGVASADRRLLRSALGGLLVQVVVCLMTSTLYFALSPLSDATSEMLTNSQATIWDLLVALVGGFAAGIGYSRQQEPATLISGVAVATALMPPLCATGYGLAMRDLALAASAFYEFLLNVVFIGFGAQLVLALLRVPLVLDANGDGVITEDERREADEFSRSMRREIVVGILLLAIPCLFFTTQVVRSSMEENGTVFETRDTYDTEQTTRELEVVCPDLVSYRIGTEDTYDDEADALVQRVVATVETGSELDESEQATIESLIRLKVPTLDEVTFEVSEG